VREFQELIVHDPVETVDTGDPVPHGGDGPDLADIDARFIAFDLLLDDLRDFIGFDIHGDP
jgi:hypothetical protein